MSPSSFLSQFRPAIRKSVNLLVLVLLVISTVNAQSKRELEQRKIKLQKEINEANRQLAKLAKSKTATLAQIDALKKKIKARSALIATVNSEINLIGQEINQTDLSISSLETEMKELRQGYANMILYAQKNNNRFKRLYFIFAADNFNQAYKRIIFLKQINQYRNQQAILIDSTQAELSRKKSELELQRNQKTLLRNNELKERQQLASEKKQQDLLMAGMQNQEKKLRAQVAEKQKAKVKLERAIADLIRKEIEAAKKKATAAGNKHVTRDNVFSLTPEAKKLSSTFAGSKGSLPWPVDKGRISSRFGSHPHPGLKGVMINNDGVDIQTAPGTDAKSVFNGEVTGVIDIPGSGHAIIIRHGEYLTVYSNLQIVTVKKGDKITTRQVIGKPANEDSGNALLNFQIWKGFSKLNPEEWMARR